MTCDFKRVTIFPNGVHEDGKVLAVKAGQTLQYVLNAAGRKLGMVAKYLFTVQGGVVDDVDLIKDEDTLYVSSTDSFVRLREPKRRERETRRPFSDITSKSVAGTNWVTLNVGGKYFTTTRSTLVSKEPGSMLSRMFDDDDGLMWNNSVDGNGAFLIDRSPVYFEPILNYLRHGELILDKHLNAKGVLEEARFFGIVSLVEELEEKIQADEPANDNTPITRREFILRLLGTPSNCELRCQGMNFTGADFSRLDLRYVNFKHAVLKRAKLTGANLAYCNFERADISNANLDGANLLGAKMVCVNLEASSLQGCNFEDPAGSRTNMEGANMKCVNLEGSQMAGVNLRVANLKKANLQNCDLRGAVLAGADLENCDLSACDLQEANLRGANLKGAAFELMRYPLHMSQTVR